MTLQELLDSQGMGDTMELEVGGHKFTLGDIRKYRSERRDAVEKEIRLAEAKRQEAEKNAIEAATLLQQLQDAAKQTPKAPEKKADGGYDFRTDPLFAPLVAHYDGQLQKALELAEKSAKEAADLKKSLNETASVYAYERLQREYETAPQSFRDKYKFDELAKEVITAGEKDRFGLPTISRRVKELTEPDRIAEASAKAVADARKQWESEQAAAAAKPGGAARFTNRKNTEPPVKRIEDITSDMVAGDPDVQAAMRGEPVQ